MSHCGYLLLLLSSLLLFLFIIGICQQNCYTIVQRTVIKLFGRVIEVARKSCVILFRKEKQQQQSNNNGKRWRLHSNRRFAKQWNYMTIPFTKKIASFALCHPRGMKNEKWVYEHQIRNQWQILKLSNFRGIYSIHWKELPQTVLLLFIFVATVDRRILGIRRECSLSNNSN